MVARLDVESLLPGSLQRGLEVEQARSLPVSWTNRTGADRRAPPRNRRHRRPAADRRHPSGPRLCCGRMALPWRRTRRWRGRFREFRRTWFPRRDRSAPATPVWVAFCAPYWPPSRVRGSSCHRTRAGEPQCSRRRSWGFVSLPADGDVAGHRHSGARSLKLFGMPVCCMSE